MKWRGWLSRWVPGFPGIILIVVLLTVNIILSGTMISLGSINDLVQVGMPLAVATLGQGLVIIQGGIDLSIGGIMSLANVLIVVLLPTLGFWPALLVAMATSVVAGLINGVVIVYGRVQPLVATLAMSFVASGVALSLLPQPGGSVATGVGVYMGTFLGFSTGIWVLVVLLLLWLVVKRFFGLAIYATGGQEHAAQRNAVNVNRVHLWAYTLSGLIAGLAGLAVTLEIASGDASIGASYVLPSVAAVVLGGTSLAGGSGGLVGPVMAAFALTEVSNVVFSTGVSSYYQTIVSSAVVILGLAVANIVKRRSSLLRQS
ncbi:MAG: ABC transporter permease [Firmicutes bacterium]|nr:ABC transporter permease [Bacillota bacterium]